MSLIETDPIVETNPEKIIDSLFQADLPQVSDQELDTEQQVVLFSIDGNFFNRIDPIIKSQFPSLKNKAKTQTRQTRLVPTTNQDGSSLTFTAWDREKHGEFRDIPPCQLTPQELQDLLEEAGLDLDPSLNSSPQANKLENVRKKGASTKAIPF